MEYSMTYQNLCKVIILPLLSSLLFVFYSGDTNARSVKITGDWQANLTISKDKVLPLLIHLETDDGEISGYLDSPTMGKFDQPLTLVKVEGNKFVFEIDSWNVHFEGEFNQQKKEIIGTFIEGSFVQSLTFNFIEQSTSSHIDDVVGDWHGEVISGESKPLTFVLHVANNNGVLTATADSPDQGGYGMKIDSVVFSQGVLVFDVNKADVNYTGTLTENKQTLYGAFTQQGDQMGLTMTKQKPSMPASNDNQ
jgi:hypothetical protein